MIQALGDLLSKFVLPFIPGPVRGLVLLLAFLALRGIAWAVLIPYAVAHVFA
jgi:putative effector of murein hydrolase LrgA (UPF0299 family)